MMADLTSNDRTVLLQHSEQTTVPAAQTAVMFAPQQQLQYAMPVGNMTYSMPTAQAVPVNVGMPSAAPGQQVYVLQGGNSANQPQIQPVAQPQIQTAAQPGMIQIQYGMTPVVQTPQYSMTPAVQTPQYGMTPAVRTPLDAPLINQTPMYCSNNDARKFAICGILQIIAGVVCIVLSVVLLAMREFLMLFGVSLWGGVMFVVAGTFGFLNARKFLKCYMITCMTLSILSSLISFISLVTSALSVYYWSYIGWIPAFFCLLCVASAMEFVASICQASLFCRYAVKLCSKMGISYDQQQQVPIVIYLNIPPGTSQQTPADDGDFVKDDIVKKAT